MFLFCPKKLLQNVTVWKKYLPSVNLYYAMKCNPHPKVIKELSKLDVNFECAAISEIKQCLPYNKDIIYGHPHKSVDEIVKAKNYGIYKIVYDSISQLKLIHNIYPESAPILRIQSCEDKSKIKFNQKFGAHDDELDELFNYHNINKYNLYGLSFHVGSKCYHPEQYINTVDKIKILIDKYQLKIKIIDIGGGFPSDLSEDQFKNHAYVIENYIQKYTSLRKYTFVGEPGRYIIDNTMSLKVKVINKKVRDNINIYYINDGIYSSLNGVISDSRELDIETNVLDKFKSILYGNTCDSFDKIECELPEYNINDIINIKNIGAYSWTSASSFNGFTPAKIKYYIC
jgi:ornithine decarboxylase